jgi:hypothetical protein
MRNLPGRKGQPPLPLERRILDVDGHAYGSPAQIAKEAQSALQPIVARHGPAAFRPLSSLLLGASVSLARAFGCGREEYVRMVNRAWDAALHGADASGVVS